MIFEKIQLFNLIQKSMLLLTLLYFKIHDLFILLVCGTSPVERLNTQNGFATTTTYGVTEWPTVIIIF